MATIKYIQARQILDSRGYPTIEVDVISTNGVLGRASVPSGASTGEYEAIELRDNDKNKYLGKGVLKAIDSVNKVIFPKLIGYCINNQRLIDNVMIRLDNTESKSNLGANAILGVSLAVAKVAAKELNLPLYRYIGGINAYKLPVPMMNIINGGSHSDAPIAFQEFMIRPIGADTFSTAIRMGAEIFHHLKKVLQKKGLSTAIGDEGGFSPNFTEGIEEALECILTAIKQAGYKPNEEVTIGIDCASSEFFINGKYDYSKFEGSQGKIRTREEQVEYLALLCKNYPIDSIEDGCDENDWKGFSLLTDRIGDKCQLVGDDLYVTNVKFLARGIVEKSSNSILIKVNQIGTLSETLDVIEMAHKAGFRTIISHRSGETEDTTIADIAVATNAGQIKTGSASRSERMAKYNQLLRIEEELGEVAVYEGKRYN